MGRCRLLVIRIDRICIPPSCSCQYWHVLRPTPNFSLTPPGGWFVYEFTLHQEGTYFYHSHMAMQEMMGMIGAFIMHPKEQYRPHADKDFASRLNIIRKSIETYRARIQEKLVLRTRADSGPDWCRSSGRNLQVFGSPSRMRMECWTAAHPSVPSAYTASYSRGFALRLRLRRVTGPLVGSPRRSAESPLSRYAQLLAGSFQPREIWLL
jgi:hypothetical protein